MAQTLQTLSVISFAVAGVCLVLAIFFWFFFKIPNVIGDLSGRTARKSIAKMRVANEKTGVKSYKESKTNAERGKLTATMSNSRKNDSSDKPETGILLENKAESFETEKTDVLDEETAFLDSEATTLLIDENIERVERDINAYKGDKKLEIIEEVVYVHTGETIL